MRPPPSIPASSWSAGFHTYYVDSTTSGTSRIHLEVTFFDAPSYVDATIYVRFTAGHNPNPREWPAGSWTGHKLSGDTWHWSEIGTPIGPNDLIVASNGVEVNVSFTKFSAPVPSWDSRLNSDPRFKGVRHPLAMTEDEASGIESLAETALKNAVAFRSRGYK